MSSLLMHLDKMTPLKLNIGQLSATCMCRETNEVRPENKLQAIISFGHAYMQTGTLVPLYSGGSFYFGLDVHSSKQRGCGPLHHCWEPWTLCLPFHGLSQGSFF